MRVRSGSAKLLVREKDALCASRLHITNMD